MTDLNFVQTHCLQLKGIQGVYVHYRHPFVTMKNHLITLEETCNNAKKKNFELKYNDTL